MILSDFQTTTHGKWILAGEHAVIRGHSALVFPIPTKKLTLSYNTTPSGLHADYSGSNGEDAHLLFWSVLEHGLQLLDKSINSLTGHFKIHNTIPIGAGMGASAALCVAVTRWFTAQSMVAPENWLDFAKNLENLFHGQSSGLDIAGVASDKGIYFKKGQFSPIQQTWHPLWYLSSCEQIGITSHCINQVNKLWQEMPEVAANLDKQMDSAVSDAQAALENNSLEGFNQLAGAINQAADCFSQWGLMSENLVQHIDQLKKAGAIAAKPTGSGGGGFVISLWASPPPSEKLSELIPV